MSGLLSFLKSGTVEEVAKAAAGVRSKQRNPNPGIVAIRIFKDGSVFPSKAAVDKFDLEYRSAVISKEAIPLKEGQVLKEGETQKFRNIYEFPSGTGNGLDVIATKKSTQIKLGKDVIFVAVTPKGAGKVDLFSSTNYNEDGTPKTSVMDQGAVTFGDKILLNLLMEDYGIILSEEKPYVDLMISETITEGTEVFNVTEHFSRPILLVPKTVARGDDKGKDDYERRENVKVYLLAPPELVDNNYKAPALDDAEAEETVAGAAKAAGTPKSKKKETA